MSKQDTYLLYIIWSVMYGVGWFCSCVLISAQTYFLGPYAVLTFFSDALLTEVQQHMILWGFVTLFIVILMGVYTKRFVWLPVWFVLHTAMWFIFWSVQLVVLEQVLFELITWWGFIIMSMCLWFAAKLLMIHATWFSFVWWVGIHITGIIGTYGLFWLMEHLLHVLWDVRLSSVLTPILVLGIVFGFCTSYAFSLLCNKASRNQSISRSVHSVIE